MSWHQVDRASNCHGTKLTEHLTVMAPQISVAHTVFFGICLKTPSLAPALLLSSSFITASK